MKKLMVLSCLIVFYSNTLKAQLSEGSKIGANTGNGMNSTKAGVFWNAPTPASNVIGQFYLDSLWHEGNVRFNKVIPQFGGSSTDSLNGILIRYNVFNDQLEVLADKGKNDVRVIQGDHLKNFTIKLPGDEKLEFVNAGSFKSAKELTGFFETLVPGKLPLLKLFRAKTIKPTYNAGFGTGEKNTIVSIASDYYILFNGSVEKINPGKKSLLSLMKDKEGDVENYIKSNNVDFKNENDLVGLFEFYNK